MTGDKRFLGVVETDTENEKVLTPFLRSLVERGLDVSQGLLVIVDGGKGLRAAVRKAFRHRALVQRCQWLFECDGRQVAAAVYDRSRGCAV